MKVQVVVEIPDEIMQDALQALAEKHSINIGSLSPEEAIAQVSQAVADEVLRSIGKDLIKRKADEEKSRLAEYIPEKKILWPAPEIAPPGIAEE